MAIQPQSRCEPLAIQVDYQQLFQYKAKLMFRIFVNYSIINKNANVNSFRKKVNFFFTIFACYGTIKIRNGKDGLAQGQPAEKSSVCGSIGK